MTKLNMAVSHRLTQDEALKRVFETFLKHHLVVKELFLKKSHIIYMITIDNNNSSYTTLISVQLGKLFSKHKEK